MKQETETYFTRDLPIITGGVWYIVAVQEHSELLLEDFLSTQLQPHSSNSHQSISLPKDVSNSSCFS